MIKRTLSIGRWVVDFLFCEGRYDIDGVVACLYDSYAPDRVVSQAIELMESCRYDCGFTYANELRRRAVVLIGPTSSGDEFIDTLVHEIRHLADSVAHSIGVKLDSEIPAYISGDAARALARTICEMGCTHCRKQG